MRDIMVHLTGLNKDEMKVKLVKIKFMNLEDLGT